MGILIFVANGQDATGQNFWAWQKIYLLWKTKILFFLTMTSLISVKILKNP